MIVKVATSHIEGKIGKEEIDRWRVFNGSFVNEDLTVEHLIEKIKNSYAYTTQHERYRDSDNFVCGQHLGLDFDTEDWRSTFEFLLENEFIAKHASFLHTTPSHKHSAPRCRVVFVLDRPIYDKEKYAELAQALVHKFNLADSSCKDPARFFYGAKNAEVHPIGYVLTVENAARELVFPYREYLVEKKRIDAENAKNRVIAGAGEVPQSLLDNHSASLIERVVTAQDGEKHYELRKIATTFGGYVAGGYYDYNDVIQWMKNAIRQNPNSVEDYVQADKTIESGVVHGMHKPLYYDVRDDEYIPEERKPEDIPELDEVHPPLTISQKEQVSRIIEKKVWEVYVQLRQEKDVSELDIDFNGVLLDHLRIGYKPSKIDNETGEIYDSAITVPYFFDEDVIAVEYRWSNGSFTYDGDASLYKVKSFFEEETKFGVVLPDSLMSAKTYVTSEGVGDWYGLPHTNITVRLPDQQLYCFFDTLDNVERLELLDAFGTKFVRVFSVEQMVENLTRKEIERIAIRGRSLKEII